MRCGDLDLKWPTGQWWRYRSSQALTIGLGAMVGLMLVPVLVEPGWPKLIPAVALAVSIAIAVRGLGAHEDRVLSAYSEFLDQRMADAVIVRLQQPEDEGSQSEPMH